MYYLYRAWPFVFNTKSLKGWSVTLHVRTLKLIEAREDSSMGGRLVLGHLPNRHIPDVDRAFQSTDFYNDDKVLRALGS